MGNEVKQCQQPQAHPERCGCAPAGTEQVSSTWLAQLREEYRLFGSECQRLRAENERLFAQRDAILLLARMWAGEAKTQQSITREVGEILGGIPNWGPIAAAVEAMRSDRQALKGGADGGHPMQSIVFAENGVVRFKQNRIVRHLLDFATPLGCGLNELARQDFTQDDRMQLAQLIGYSVSGYGDLSYASQESVECADEIAAAMIATHSAKEGG